MTRTKSIPIFTALAFLTLPLVAEPATAQQLDYWASPAGSDTNPNCTFAAPCRTFDRAYTRLAAADYGTGPCPKIRLMPGTYDASVRVSFSLLGCSASYSIAHTGPLLEIVGDDLNKTAYILNCPPGNGFYGCFTAFQPLYVHGVTFSGSAGAFAVGAYNQTGLAIIANVRYINFSSGQIVGAGNRGTMYLDGDHQIDTNANTLIANGPLGFTGLFQQTLRFIVNSPVNMGTWFAADRSSVISTYGPPPLFTGNGVPGSTGVPITCSDNSIVTLGGAQPPGNQPNQITSGCCANGVCVP